MHARPRTWAGIGALAFGVLWVAALVIANAPGGDYSPGDIDSFTAQGHRAAVIASLYLGVAAVVGLVSLLLQLHRASRSDSRLASLGLATGMIGAAGLAIGWALALAEPIGLVNGGHSVSDPVSYMLSQIGLVVIIGPGAICLGVAIAALAVCQTASQPAWLRALGVNAALGALASQFFFPF